MTEGLAHKPWHNVIFFNNPELTLEKLHSPLKNEPSCTSHCAGACGMQELFPLQAQLPVPLLALEVECS